MIVPFITSSYSFNYGTCSPKDLVCRAKELGYKKLAICERETLSSVPTFIEECEKNSISPIIALELYDKKKPNGLFCTEGNRFVIIALTRKGFSFLSESASMLCEKNYNATDAIKYIYEKSQNEKAINNDIIFASDDIKLLEQNIFSNVYGLLSQCNKKLWKTIIDYAKKTIAFPEFIFTNDECIEIQKLLIAIGNKSCMENVSSFLLKDKSAIMVSPFCTQKNWEYNDEALCENRKLLDCDGHGALFNGFIFPDTEIDSNAKLRNLTYAGAKKHYSQNGNIPQNVIQRIEHELDVIQSKGFSSYFLVVKNIIEKATRICGRGSAASSIVSFCLDISSVDPIKHNLYFERFLNPGRSDYPDIDIDFAWDERDGILDSVLKEYKNACRVCNHIFYKFDSAIRESARAFGIPENEISSFQHELSIDYEKATTNADPEWKKIIYYAKKIEGLPHQYGVHSGGIILTPCKISSLVPLTRSGSGIRIAEWEKDGCEDAGLVKIDLLGNRSLAVVRDAINNIKQNGKQIDEQNWNPIIDKDTINILSQGNTIGVFYVESPAMRLLQTKTGMGDFEHLVIHSSIIRPAANKYINEYIDRLKGKKWEALHPLIKDTLSETFGIMCYQEDVCKVAIALANFDASKADKLRKCLSKKNPKERLAFYKNDFYNGAKANAVPIKTIDEVWAMIESFSGYSFVKAHSASYAMLSFKSAYIKSHFPAEFMAGVISNRGGYYSTSAYISESRRLGIRVINPDICKSELRCYGNSEQMILRLGLSMINGLSEKCASSIVNERKTNGMYKSIEDLSSRVFIDRTDAEALTASGALDRIDTVRTHAQKLMVLLSSRMKQEQKTSVRDLFSICEDDEKREKKCTISFENSLESTDIYENIFFDKLDLKTKLRYYKEEIEALGTTLAFHPITLIPEFRQNFRIKAIDIPKYAGKNVRLLGWLVTAKTAITSSEELMEFITFEDESAIYETVFFPAAFAKFRFSMSWDSPYIIYGKVEEDRGAYNITVNNINILKAYRN